MKNDFRFRAWDAHNKVMKHYTLKQLADEDRFNYDTEFEAIQSGFDNWVWAEFTGFKDKLGVGIFQGDIFGTPNLLRCVVERERDGRWILRFIDPRMNPISILDDRISKLSPIGNIYQNPELLTP